MNNWWVPGLQIGYEHSFVHQVADFLEALGKGSLVIPPSAMRWKRRRSATRCCRVPPLAAGRMSKRPLGDQIGQRRCFSKKRRPS